MKNVLSKTILFRPFPGYNRTIDHNSYSGVTAHFLSLLFDP